jgi:hypothetical protein
MIQFQNKTLWDIGDWNLFEIWDLEFGILVGPVLSVPAAPLLADFNRLTGTGGSSW